MLKYPSVLYGSAANPNFMLYATTDIERKDDPSVYKLLTRFYSYKIMYFSEGVALSSNATSAQVYLEICPIKG